LKNLTKLIYLLLLLALTGCQTDSTITLQKIIVEDQAFTLSANSPEGTKVGQVVVSQPTTTPLRFQLVAGSYSYAFILNDSTGELFVLNTKALLSIPVGAVELDVLVSSCDTQFVYGEIARLKINIIDLPEYATIRLYATSGALVNSGNPTVNFSPSELLYINSWTVGLQPMAQRSYLQFNLDTLPLAAEIESATLKLFNPNDGNIDHTHQCHDCTNPFYIRRVLSAWKSSFLTWSTQPGYTTNDQTIAPASMNSNQNYSVNVTEAVKTMVANRELNYGFVLMLTEEEPYRRLCFCSVNHPNSELRPMLEITLLH
jgi:hypothetical protein